MLELPCKKTTEFSSENSNISFENLEEPQLSQRAAVSDADTPSNSDPSEEPPDEKDNFQGDTEVVRTETNLDSSKCKNITFNRSEDEQALDEQQSRTLHVDDVVGCGIIWPSKKIFFTVDGIGTQKVFDFPAEKDTNLNQIFPYVSRCDIHINFGQQAFVNEENNVPNNKFNSAEILYDVIMSQEQTDPK